MNTGSPLFLYQSENSPYQRFLIEYFNWLPPEVQDIITRVVSCDARLLWYSTDFGDPIKWRYNWVSIAMHKNTFSWDVVRRLSHMNWIILPDSWYPENEKKFDNLRMWELFRGDEPDISSRPFEKVIINASSGWNRFIVDAKQPDRIKILTNTLTATNDDFVVSSIWRSVQITEQVKVKLNVILWEFWIALSSSL
jgi:hypothetical protein